MAFPQTPLDVLIELFISGAWTNITTDVYTRDGIHISRGRADEAARVDPGKCTMTLNNGASKVAPGVTGRYSPRNPLSDLFGKIGRNTPLRVSVNAGDSYLATTGTNTSNNGASTPDTAALDIVGDLDIRFEARLDNWMADGSVELCGKGLIGGNQRSWLLMMRDRKLHLEWSAAGTTTVQVDSTAEIQLPPSERLAVRVTLDVDNGASGNTATFYTAPSIGGTWTQLGNPVVTAGTTSIFNSTAPVRVGDGWGDLAFPCSSGAVYAFELRNGIGGTLVANPNFRVQTPGAVSFADGTGKTWTVGASTTISNRKTRFVGEVSSWPPRWDVSGKDVYTPVEAAGILRRLGQGASPLQSTLRRRIPNYPNISPTPVQVVAYWPMEEERNATQAYSPIPGVRPLNLTGFDMASDDSLAGSSALPSIKGGATLSGTVPAPTGTVTQWHTEFVFFTSAGPTTTRTVLQWLGTGTVKRWRLMIDSGGCQIHGYDDNETEIVTELVAITSIFNRWCRWKVYATQSGGNVNYTIQWVTVGAGSASVSGSYAGSVGRISGVSGPDPYSSDLDGFKIGHLGVLTVADTLAYNDGDIGFAGETAGARMERLAGEEGIPIAVYGDASAMELVGAQRPDAVLNLLEDAGDADHGILYEARETIGLSYRDRSGLYNQTPTLALDYAVSGHVAPPLEPVDDDQSVTNDVTVTRAGGSSARAVQDTGPLNVQTPDQDPDGVGRYDESVTLNLYNDDQAADHAGWLLHLGTWDETRYPVLRVNLAAAPSLIEAVTAIDLGDRITVAHPPAWLPLDLIDLLGQGYSETLGHPNDWVLEFNCTPAGPWDVAVSDDFVLGHVDTDGSTLAASYTSTDTVLSVTTPGTPWVTDHSDTPFDLRVAGEVMTCAVLGNLLTTNPFMTVDATGWTTSSSSIAWTQAVVHPAAKPNQGSILVTPDGVSASGGVASTPRTAAGTITPGASYVAMGWVYSPGGWSDLRAVVDFYDASSVFLSSGLGSGTAVAAGTWTFLAQTLVAPASSSRASVRIRHGGTPASSAVYYAWGIRLLPAASVLTSSPQTMSVTRSVNGVIKSQSAGADVLLADPAIVAL